jgi:hypothetical protein
LLIGETYHTADVFYKTQALFADPVIYLERSGGETLLVCRDFAHPGAAARGLATLARRTQGISRE